MRSVRTSTFVSSGAAGLVLYALLSVARAHAGAQGDLPAPLRRGTVKALAAGKLLVAARNLPDPNFAETIVLLADFNERGAMGIIVNRRTDVTLARIAPGLEQPRAHPTVVFFGGPVAVPGVLAMVRAASAPADTRHVVGDIYLVNTREALEKLIATAPDSNRLRVYVGYAGWGADQLNAETAEGAWYVVNGDSEVVFDPEPDSAWERQIRRTEALHADRAASPRCRTDQRARIDDRACCPCVDSPYPSSVRHQPATP